MKKILLLIVFLFTNHFFGQQKNKEFLAITYKETIINERQLEEPRPYYYLLKINTQKNISIYDKIEDSSSTLTDTNKESRAVEYKPKGKNLSVVYKNYNTNELYSKGMISLKFLTIKDSLNIFNWKIEDKTKKINGYICQLATTSFRGRDYEAWFTNDLPQGGPWKYDGLPGLILDIKSIDNYIHITAESISANLEFEKSLDENPFLEDKSLSWDEFKKKYKEKAIALTKYKFNDGSTGGIYTPRILRERLIEENDPDYTLRVNFK